MRFFLLCSPRRLFLWPGALLTMFGLIGYALAIPAITMDGATFDAHTLLFASLALLTGYQCVLYGLFAKVFAVGEGLLPPDARLKRLRSFLSTEAGLGAGAVACLAGSALLGRAVFAWMDVGFGRLNYASTMRIVVPGITLFSLGIQTMFAAFLLGVMELRRR